MSYRFDISSDKGIKLDVDEYYTLIKHNELWNFMKSFQDACFDWCHKHNKSLDEHAGESCSDDKVEVIDEETFEMIDGWKGESK